MLFPASDARGAPGRGGASTDGKHGKEAEFGDIVLPGGEHPGGREPTKACAGIEDLYA